MIVVSAETRQSDIADLYDSGAIIIFEIEDK